MLISGTMMTVPEISVGFSIPINFSSAMIEVYSVPCAPATSASTGPGFAPWKTATGMLRPASTPGGTSMVPVALCPRAAVAVPTVKVPRGCATDTTTRTDASNPTAETNRIMIISHQINSVEFNLQLQRLNSLSLHWSEMFYSYERRPEDLA